MVNPGPLWQDFKQAVRRTICGVTHHRPLKIIDKATVDSVAFTTGGTGAAVHVDASHVVCQRCGARRVAPPCPHGRTEAHTVVIPGPQGQTGWVECPGPGKARWVG